MDEITQRIEATNRPIKIGDRVQAVTWCNMVRGVVVSLDVAANMATINGADLFGPIIVRYPINHLEHAAQRGEIGGCGVNSANWIDRDTPEWDRAWKELAECLPPCGMSADLGAGEGWQYMGSDEQVHTFRNRSILTHVGERRVYVHVPRNGETARVIIKPEPGVIHAPPRVAAFGVKANPEPTMRHLVRRPVEGRDWYATGNYDGFSCGSDADSGL